MINIFRVYCPAFLACSSKGLGMRLHFTSVNTTNMNISRKLIMNWVLVAKNKLWEKYTLLPTLFQEKAKPDYSSGCVSRGEQEADWDEAERLRVLHLPRIPQKPPCSLRGVHSGYLQDHPCDTSQLREVQDGRRNGRDDCEVGRDLCLQRELQFTAPYFSPPREYAKMASVRYVDFDSPQSSPERPKMIVRSTPELISTEAAN